jgi:hypothetical protein
VLLVELFPALAWELLRAWCVVEANTGLAVTAANSTTARLARKESTLVHLKTSFLAGLWVKSSELFRIAASGKSIEPLIGKDPRKKASEAIVLPQTPS